MKDYDIKKLLNTKVSDLRPREGSPNNQEFVRETIELMHEYERAIDDADVDHETRNKLILRLNVVTSLVNDLKDEEQRKGRALMNGYTGNGRPMDPEGKIKMYRPGEKIQQSTGFGEDQISLGSYLRAVVDKPRNDMERRAVQNSVGSSGYELPIEVAQELIDQLRERNPLLMENGGGARTLTLDGNESTKFIKINSDPDSVFHIENATETPSDAVFGSVDLAPKTLLSMTLVSREILMDSQNIEEALSSAFLGSMNKAILDATFAATTSNGPAGLGSLVTATQEYANAGTPSWTEFVKANTALHTANVPEDNRSHLMAPDVWENIQLQADTTGQFITPPSGIANIPGFTSSGVPAGVGYAGDFSNAVYGFRLNFTLEQHPSFGATSYQNLWVASMRYDFNLFRPSAFVRIEEAAV